MTAKRSNPDKANVLKTPDRMELLPPDKIIGHLDIKSSDTIADLGAGNGYFAIPMAQSTKQFVYAVDIEPKMLEMLKENAEQKQLENITYVESDLDRIQLDGESVNKVMISLVLHEVPNLDKTLSEIKRILKPGGEILIKIGRASCREREETAETSAQSTEKTGHPSRSAQMPRLGRLGTHSWRTSTSNR